MKISIKFIQFTLKKQVCIIQTLFQSLTMTNVHADNAIILYLHSSCPMSKNKIYKFMINFIPALWSIAVQNTTSAPEREKSTLSGFDTLCIHCAYTAAAQFKSGPISHIISGQHLRALHLVPGRNCWNLGAHGVGRRGR